MVFFVLYVIGCLRFCREIGTLARGWQPARDAIHFGLCKEFSQGVIAGSSDGLRVELRLSGGVMAVVASPFWGVGPGTHVFYWFEGFSTISLAGSSFRTTGWDRLLRGLWPFMVFATCHRRGFHVGGTAPTPDV